MTAFFKYFFLFMGAVQLVVSAYFYISTSTFLQTAFRTEGTVVEMVRSEHKRRPGESLRERRSRNSYKPVVNFVTPKGEKIEFVSFLGSNLNLYHTGQKVDVAYQPDDPHNAKIYDFLSLWALPMAFGSVGGILFLIGGGIMLVPILKERRHQYLRENGIPIKTEFQRVLFHDSIRINNKRPYQVLTQWQNPSTSEIHVFRSSYLMFDPTQHIKTKQITVFIEKDNPRKYFVDLSFLPKMAD